MAHGSLVMDCARHGERRGLKPAAKRARVGLRFTLAPLLCLMSFMAWPAMVLSGCSAGAANGNVQAVAIGGRMFRLEIAADDAARIQGLSDRPSIAPDGGMLFVFPDAEQREFVMRRCPIPIDIIFLDPTGRIVQMHEMTPEPPDTTEEDLHRYPSDWPAQFAIELRGGTLKELGLSKGQKIELPLDDLKRRAR